MDTQIRIRWIPRGLLLSAVLIVGTAPLSAGGRIAALAASVGDQVRANAADLHGRLQVRSSEQPASPDASPVLRVRVDAAESIARAIAELDYVSVVTGGEYDLLVETDRRARCWCVTVRDGGGAQVAGPLDVISYRAVGFVRQWALAHRLRMEPLPGPGFDVVLDVVERRTGRQVTELVVGRDYEIAYGADVPACFLLVAVDAAGGMQLLVPRTGRDLEPALEGRLRVMVTPPGGTEFLRLFAFRECPGGLDTWLPERGADRPRLRSIDSRPALESLLGFVRQHAEVAAETTRELSVR